MCRFLFFCNRFKLSRGEISRVNTKVKRKSRATSAEFALENIFIVAGINE